MVDLFVLDFGFLFESSPGGNLGFEPDFKLTERCWSSWEGRAHPTTGHPPHTLTTSDVTRHGRPAKFTSKRDFVHQVSAATAVFFSQLLKCMVNKIDPFG